MSYIGEQRSVARTIYNSFFQKIWFSALDRPTFFWAVIIVIYSTHSKTFGNRRIEQKPPTIQFSKQELHKQNHTSKQTQVKIVWRNNTFILKRKNTRRLREEGAASLKSHFILRIPKLLLQSSSQFADFIVLGASSRTVANNATLIWTDTSLDSAEILLLQHFTSSFSAASATTFPAGNEEYIN